MIFFITPKPKLCSVFKTIMYTWNTDGDEIVFPLVMHLVFVVAIGFSHFVAVGLKQKAASKQGPFGD